MEFRLVYEGRLRASGNAARHVKDKHHIRKVFHKQLEELWDRHPVLRGRKTEFQEETSGIAEMREKGVWFRDPGATEAETLSRQFERCGFRFLPLVNKHFSLVCGLNILFLRRENPGDLIMQGGDIDNRVKTLLDALRIPENCSEVDGLPETDETPFYCLLESDTLVTELAVTTDRLLVPLKPGQHENEVHLIIQVKVKASSINLSNFNLLS
jgi:hypothetical protein